MNAIVKKVKEYISKHQMIVAKDTVVAGISGGADSVCLLFVLQEIRKELPFHLVVVHVNHGIREEAGLDAEYVESLCRRMEIPFYLYERNVKEIAVQEGLSEEEAGRQVRYAAFEEVLEKELSCQTSEGCGRIAVAHNQNDRAETMLFQLFRGSGLKGLAGIRPVRENIIRPILCLKREEIEEFLQEKGISYCIDFTNEEDTYTRNKIRHHVLAPAIDQVSCKTVEHMAATADILLEAEDYLEEETKKAYAACVKEQKEGLAVEVEAFRKLHPYLQKQVVFASIQSIVFSRKDITSVHIRDVLELFEKEGNRQICLPYGLHVKRQYGQVFFGTQAKNKDCCISKQEYVVGELSAHRPKAEIVIEDLGALQFTWMEQKREQFQVPEENLYTKWLDYDKIKQSLVIRTRRTGDYLTINEQGSRQTIKKYMIQEKIPTEKRENILLLADGSHVMWAIGYRISTEYKVNENTKNILKVQFRGGQ